MAAVGYEVTLHVDAAIADAYLAWLQGHVAQMKALPGFTGGRAWRVLEPAPAAGEVVFCCLYELRDADALEDYLREHAPRMRADGIHRFGDRFRASRRVLGALGAG